MGLITVDAEKCIHCGTCLEECPFRLLEMKTESSLPTPREIEVRSAEERCINCGHCMAVCPVGATAATMMHPPAREAVGGLIPFGCDLYDSMSIGYPKNTFQRIPLRNEAIINWV